MVRWITMGAMAVVTIAWIAVLAWLAVSLVKWFI
jgi:hypothetical protein